MIKLYNVDCLKYLDTEAYSDFKDRKVIMVTDPPFNIGYHYSQYKDRLNENDYLLFLQKVLRPFIFEGLVIIHYPEMLYKVSKQIDLIPEKIVSWVYNSNTARQHRDIAFFKIKPDFRQVIQPYKNLNDKRIKNRIARGIRGGDYMIGGILTK